MFVLSWLVVPLLLAVLSLGCGLAVAAIAARLGPPRGEPLSGVLVAPVGFAALVVLTSLVTTWRATAWAAGALPAVVAVVGLWLGRERLGAWWAMRRQALWPIVAAGLPAASLAAPVILTGRPGLSGFGKITDLAHQISFTEYLRTDGRAPVGIPDSSYEEIVDKLVDSGYPGGTQSVVAAMADLGHLDVAWAYQPVLAFCGAMLGLALFSVLRRAIPHPAWRAAAAGVAAQPTILYAYALAAGIKELSGAAAIVLVAAVLADRPRWQHSSVVPAAVAIASSLSIFNLTILPWLGAVLAVLFALELFSESGRTRAIGRWVATSALALVLAAPALAAVSSLVRASGGTSGPAGLGNLAAPLPVWSAVGPWMTPDHRFPLAQYGLVTPTYLLIAIAVALAAVGLITAVRARDRGLVALGVSGVMAVAFMLRFSDVWLQLKAFCVTAPITLALAFAGGAWLVRRVSATRTSVLTATAAVAAGVLYGNALQYHHTTLLDHAKMADLEGIDARYAGRGPALLTEFDEFAEYFLRDTRASGLVNPWRSQVLYNRTATPGLQMVRDTDEYDQRWLQGFRLIIRRRNPTASRPPSTFELARTTRDYEVWTRVGDPRRVLAHFPLSGRRSRSQRFCRGVRDAADRAGAGARMATVAPSDPIAVTATPSGQPPLWGRRGDTLLAGTPGRWQEGFRVARTGTYRAYLLSSVGRRITISIDGRSIGSLRWRESYPGQFNSVARVRLRAGDHRMEVLRGGGDLLPGTGNDAAGTTTSIGPFVLAPTGPRPAIRRRPASRAYAVCRSGAPLDWIEVLAPR